MSPFTPSSGPVRSSSVCSGFFISEEVDGIGDKGSGDTVPVDVQTPQVFF